MKILHICETARGGVGTYIDTLAELEEGRAEHLVVLPAEHQAILAARVPRRLFSRPDRSVLAILRMMRTAVSARRSFRPDIVFCHSTLSLMALAVLRPISPGTKFIYCAHGWAGAREMASLRKARLVRALEGRLCGLAHRVVNVSRPDLEYSKAEGYRGRQILIENAVRPARQDVPEARLSGPQDALHLLFVGRLDRQKGLDLLLPAFARARAKNPQLRLHVIGEAVVPGGAGAADAAPEGVEFLGWIGADRIDAWYRAADLVVVPSRWEAFGLVVAESLRNGTPALVSNRGGLPGLIEEGISGFSVPLDPDALTAALAGLDKNILAAMRPASLARFTARFHSDRLGHEIFALYQDLTRP